MKYQAVGIRGNALTPEQVLSLYLTDVSSILSIEETVNYIDTPDSYSIPKISEEIDYLSYATGGYHSVIQINEVFLLIDAIHQLHEDNIDQSILFTETATPLLERIEHIIEVLNLLESVTTNLDGLGSIVTVLALQDVLEPFVYKSVEEIVLVTDEINSRIEYYTRILEQILFSETATYQHGLVLIVNESVNYVNTVSNIAVLIDVIREGVEFFASLQFSGDTAMREEFTAYTVNTKTKGISEYTNYAFNSFSYPLAASTDGIYQLDNADDDDGVNIEASIKTGLMDFGSSLKKQVPWAYLGITENGRVLLKTISDNFGIKKERWYEARAYNSAVDTTRVQMGKGVKAKYWQFELSNIEGEEFSLDSMEVVPLVLQRRKQ